MGWGVGHLYSCWSLHLSLVQHPVPHAYLHMWCGTFVQFLVTPPQFGPTSSAARISSHVVWDICTVLGHSTPVWFNIQCRTHIFTCGVGHLYSFWSLHLSLVQHPVLHAYLHMWCGTFVQFLGTPTQFGPTSVPHAHLHMW